MKKKCFILISAAVLAVPAGGSYISSSAAEPGTIPVEDNTVKDGTYPAEVISAPEELGEAQAELNITDGKMTAVISLDSGEYLELDLGTAVGTDTSEDAPALEPVEPMSIDMEDGEYSIDVTLTGGSGKASVSSPTILKVEDKKAYARLEWSSANYDYMIVGTEKYLPVNTEGNSVFEIPVAVMDSDMPVIADTTAMGTPHEVRYVLNFYSDSIGSKSEMPQEAAKRVLAIAFSIILGGGILNHFVNKKRRS